jgi:hypothetical protein
MAGSKSHLQLLTCLTIFSLTVSISVASEACAQNNSHSRAENIVKQNIERTYNARERFMPKAEQIAERAANQKNRETYFGHKAAGRNTLARGDGKLTQAESWHEYQMDSLVIMDDETFPQCLEPRIIAQKKNGTIRKGANELLARICDAKCPDWPLLGYPNKEWIVVSYYWPQYQVSINQAGAQMIDPAIIERQAPQKLYRRVTSLAEDRTDQERNKQKQKELMERMTIKGNEFVDPDWHEGGRWLHLRQFRELRYARAMRPNAMWNAANQRSRSDRGWKRNKQCLFDALDAPTGRKRVFANSFDHDKYAVLARFPEFRKRIDPERYEFTGPRKVRLDEYRNDRGLSRLSRASSSNLDTPCASWRMSSNRGVYRELDEIGVDEVSGNKYRDYCLPGGLDLSGSLVRPHTAPKLQADAARAAMAAIWFSQDSRNFRQLNPENRRLPKFSYYQSRHSGSLPRYVNGQTNPSENNSQIVYVDKLQRIYPTQPKGGNADGRGGASSKSFRMVQGQRGSHCFRPEDIPNWSSEDRATRDEWPLGLLLGSDDHHEETRWAIWNKRVLCACDERALFGTGCMSFDEGDHDTEVFPGMPGMDMNGRELEEPFKEGVKAVKGLARKREYPANVTSRGFDYLPLRYATIDEKQAGTTRPIMPFGENRDPSVAGTSIPGVLICPLLPQDVEPSSGDCSNGSCGQGGGASGAGGGGSPFGGGLFGEGGCADGSCAMRQEALDLLEKGVTPETSRVLPTGSYYLVRNDSEGSVRSSRTFSCTGSDCYHKAEKMLSTQGSSIFSGNSTVNCFQKNINGVLAYSCGSSGGKSAIASGKSSMAESNRSDRVVPVCQGGGCTLPSSSSQQTANPSGTSTQSQSCFMMPCQNGSCGSEEQGGGQGQGGGCSGGGCGGGGGGAGGGAGGGGMLPGIGGGGLGGIMGGLGDIGGTGGGSSGAGGGTQVPTPVPNATEEPTPTVQPSPTSTPTPGPTPTLLPESDLLVPSSEFRF